ncbi:MAG: hypothetical protein JO172_09325 [Hyphomicrobiales bacterium]|nr:hypothetical protein [Hyphomicrobiales bacterium]
MIGVYGVGAVLAAVVAWVALGFAFGHGRRKEWGQASGVGLVGLIASVAAAGLVAKAMGY